MVFTQDGEAEQTPGGATPADKQSQIGGNKVILQIAPQVFAAYEHLQPDSLTVKVGDKVKAGAAPRSTAGDRILLIPVGRRA